jgi:hypothetical protein
MHSAFPVPKHDTAQTDMTLLKKFLRPNVTRLDSFISLSFYIEFFFNPILGVSFGLGLKPLFI